MAKQVVFGLGALIGVISNGARSTVLWSQLIFLPSMLLSGFMFPFRGMPDWAQVIGNVLPLTHFLVLVRGILLKGNGADMLWSHTWPILLFMCAVLALGVLIAEPFASANHDSVSQLFVGDEVLIDMVPDGSNTSGSLGNIDFCRAITSGDSFTFDVVLDQIPANQDLSGFYYVVAPAPNSSRPQLYCISESRGTSGSNQTASLRPGRENIGDNHADNDSLSSEIFGLMQNSAKCSSAISEDARFAPSILPATISLTPNVKKILSRVSWDDLP